MKNSGVIGGLKSQLKSKLYDQLKLKSEKGGGVLKAILKIGFI